MKTNKTNPSSKNDTSVAKDRFGSRKDSQAAKINSLLSNKPVRVKDVAEKTGFEPNRVRSHLQSLVEKKLLKHNNDGTYVVAGAKKTGKPTTKKAKAELVAA